jgi:GntR family transcriptional regulator
MSPHVSRLPPPYVQIADHFRQQVQDGVIAEGDRLPSVATIAKGWGVAHATAAKAIGQLQVEGLVITSPRGTFAAGREAKATTPQARIERSRRLGTTASSGEHHRVNVAELTVAPTYIAELFALEQGEQVVRREWVTIDGGALMTLTVTWHPADLANTVPELLTRESSNVGPMLAKIEAVTGRITRGRDYIHARSADVREANALGLAVGTAIAAGTWLAWAGDRLVEYGEYCLPPRRTLTYPYDLAADGDQD